MRMIFVNLPVRDVEASKAFFAALGFGHNPDFSDETAACIVIDENVFVMVMTHDKFRTFIKGEISDAHKATEVLTCLSADSREEVDSLLAKAMAAGGKPWLPAIDMGPMYGVSFQDPDGHVWEVMHMDMSGEAAA
ncbi:VOC family protein [Phenylobacterium sp.]|uniref:VOC family protein n=1 Tax=Phenylobacterium sp. TaxID=1871053 RepID=UPI002731D751|nr:VOC family protein [Phenylobacterium sp.]MDP1616111.1 VOC family protein [Phenylobacterium sp.]MDP1988085.1 VOC family protein [Phenylobacterium sp.]